MLTTTNQKTKVLKVEDNLSFKNKVDYLQHYFSMKIYRPATIPLKTPWVIKNQPKDIPCGWVVWSFKLGSNDSGYINEISENGQTITEYVPKDEEDYYESTDTKDLRLRATRVVFMKCSNKDPWKFIGVFVPDFEQTKPHIHVFKRIATEVIVDTESLNTLELPAYML